MKCLVVRIVLAILLAGFLQAPDAIATVIVFETRD
jgi:hypothetical protein